MLKCDGTASTDALDAVAGAAAMTPKRAAALATRHAIDRASIDAARARQAVSPPSSWWAQPALTWEQFSALADSRAREVNAAMAAQHTPSRKVGSE